jgi:hypothetical protein
LSALTEAQAFERLRSMVAASSEPTLDDGEIADLLTAARRVDKWELRPDDTGWEPTYDLNAAAAEGWRRKAGKVAASFDFAVDGDSYSESQTRAACLEMAATYASRTAGSVSFSPAGGGEYVVVNRHGD